MPGARRREVSRARPTRDQAAPDAAIGEPGPKGAGHPRRDCLPITPRTAGTPAEVPEVAQHPRAVADPLQRARLTKSAGAGQRRPGALSSPEDEPRAAPKPQTQPPQAKPPQPRHPPTRHGQGQSAVARGQSAVARGQSAMASANPPQSGPIRHGQRHPCQRPLPAPPASAPAATPRCHPRLPPTARCPLCPVLRRRGQFGRVSRRRRSRSGRGRPGRGRGWRSRPATAAAHRASATRPRRNPGLRAVWLCFGGCCLRPKHVTVHLRLKLGGCGGQSLLAIAGTRLQLAGVGPGGHGSYPCASEVVGSGGL